VDEALFICWEGVIARNPYDAGLLKDHAVVLAGAGRTQGRVDGIRAARLCLAARATWNSACLRIEALLAAWATCRSPDCDRPGRRAPASGTCPSHTPSTVLAQAGTGFARGGGKKLRAGCCSSSRISDCRPCMSWAPHWRPSTGSPTGSRPSHAFATRGNPCAVTHRRKAIAAQGAP